MQDWMRKHRRLIMFFILVFIGIPFVFMFGIPSPQDSPQTMEDSAIGHIGGIPLSAAEFRRNLDSAAAMQKGQEGETPSYRDLDKDGTVQRVIEGMVDASLIKLQEQQRGFSVNETLLAKQMQKWEMFQDENGKFNHESWNEWVGNVTQWDDIYGEMRDAVARQVYIATVTAPSGRILDDKVNEDLKADHTKLRVKFAKIDPAVTPAPEEMRAHYDANPDMYRSPEQNVAEFIAISLAPVMPELATQVVQRARQGEDFAELAKSYSTLTIPEGGEMGWRAEEEGVAPHLAPLFQLLPGEVSEPVSGPTGYFIYKNEQERVNEETGVREIFARQIVLNTELSAVERAEREKKADDISVRLQAGEDVQTVAAELGLTVGKTGFYDKNSTEIENVAAADIFQFRSNSISQKDTPWKPIKASNNIYLTRITESREGAMPSFEESQDRARDNVTAEKKRTDEFKKEVQQYTDKIKASVTSLNDIDGLFPELKVVVGETTEPFTPKDNLFQYQVYVQAMEIHKAFVGMEVGKVVGPLSGFFGDAWFFELVERLEPTAEEMAALEQEREDIKKRLKQSGQYELIADFTKDLRERMLASVPFEQDAEVLNIILGRDQVEGESAEGAAETAPAEAETAEAPSTVTEVQPEAPVADAAEAAPADVSVPAESAAPASPESAPAAQ